MGALLSCLGLGDVEARQPSIAEHYQRLYDEVGELETLALERVKKARCR